MIRIYTTLIAIVVVILGLVWGGWSLYKKGYAAAEAAYQEKAIKATICKIENTETLETKKEELKKREVNLDAYCKALYHTDISACRHQLLGKH